MAKLIYAASRYWLHRGRMDAELAEEMEFHRAMLAAERSPHAAMGNTTLAREDARAVWIWPWLESLWQDACLRFAAMRREPAFTAHRTSRAWQRHRGQHAACSPSLTPSP